jgi:hypothetical protein
MSTVIQLCFVSVLEFATHTEALRRLAYPSASAARYLRLFS